METFVNKFYFREKFQTALLVCICLLTLVTEYFLGRNFSISLLAGSSTFIFFLISLTEKKLIYAKTITFIFLIFLAWTSITVFTSQNVNHSVWESVRLISVFLIFLSAFHLSVHKKQGENIVKYFFTAGSVIVAIDLFISLLEKDTTSVFYFSGILAWHNQMAAFILALLPLSVLQITTAKNKRFKILSILLFAILIAGLFLTHSRGGWLIFGVQALSIGILFAAKTKKLMLIFLTTIIISLLSAVIIEPTLPIRAESVLNDAKAPERLMHGRLETWKNSLEITQNYPLVGVGPGAFGDVYGYFQDEPWLYSLNAHSYLLQVMAESGIPALFLSGALLFIATRALLSKKYKKTPAQYAVCISLLGIFLHSLIDYDFSTVSLLVFFWLLTGAALGSSRVKTSTFIFTGWKRAVFLFLGLFTIITVCLEISEDSYYQAKFAFENGETVSAMYYLKRAQSFNPLNSDTTLLQSKIAYAKKDYSLAKKGAEESIRKLPYESSPHTILGAIAANNKDYLESAGHYQMAISKNPFADPNAYSGLAYAYEMQGMLPKADETLSYAAKNIFPLNENYKGFKDAYFQSGLTNDLANLYVILGKLKLMQDKPKEAEKLFNIVQTDLNPGANPL